MLLLAESFDIFPDNGVYVNMQRDAAGAYHENLNVEKGRMSPSSRGGYALRVDWNFTFAVWTIAPASNRIIISFAATQNDQSASWVPLIQLSVWGSPLSEHVRIQLRGNPTSTLTVVRAQNSATLMSINVPSTVGTWRWFSIEVLVDQNGSIVVSDDTRTTLGSVSGVNTKHTGSDTVNLVTLSSAVVNTNYAFYMDDLIITDDTGPTWNQRIPDTYLVTIRPNGPGTDISPGWTVNNPIEIYEAVNEVNPSIDGDLKYVERTSSGRFTSSYGDVSIPDYQIRGLIAGVATKRRDSGLWKVSNAIRFNGTTVTYEQMKATPTQNYHGFLNWIEVNPHIKTPWTQAEINAMEHGPDVILI
jgi:hypothetical protein